VGNGQFLNRGKRRFYAGKKSKAKKFALYFIKTYRNRALRLHCNYSVMVTA